MARIARVVLPGYPHHVTQRGNRRQRVFFDGEDYECYLELIAAGCRDSQTKCLAYCLMPNHVLCGAPHKRCNVKFNIM
jgi:putative transposase